MVRDKRIGRSDEGVEYKGYDVLDESNQAYYLIQNSLQSLGDASKLEFGRVIDRHIAVVDPYN